MAFNQSLERTDPNTAEAIDLERERQESTLGMIASENHVSKAVLEAQGSVLTNKYAEGYPAGGTTAAANTSTPSRNSLSNARGNCSRSTTPTCSPTVARRPTWASTFPCSSLAIRYCRYRCPTAATSLTVTTSISRDSSTTSNSTRSTRDGVHRLRRTREPRP